MINTGPRIAEVILEYQNTIDEPAVSAAQQYSQACSNDRITMDSWRDIWIKNVKANHERFGSFAEHSLGVFHKKYKYMPAVVAGAGPSLGYNAHHLKNRGQIPLISCLHNFHFFEDNEIDVDYYVTLDAGPIVLTELAEGGKKTPDEYWAATKGKVLFAYMGTEPKFFDKWQGDVYFYNCPLPDQTISQAFDEVEQFHIYVSSGGNVLGAAMYIAKGFFGCNPIAYVGADFCFSYMKKFHSWNSSYDANLGMVVRLVDVFGNKVLSWQSYTNFKLFFEYVARVVPGIWINCSEGGAFGSYPEGNIRAVQQMHLSKFLEMYRLHEDLTQQIANPKINERKILF